MPTPRAKIPCGFSNAIPINAAIVGCYDKRWANNQYEKNLKWSTQRRTTALFEQSQAYILRFGCVRKFIRGPKTWQCALYRTAGALYFGLLGGLKWDDNLCPFYCSNYLFNNSLCPSSKKPASKTITWAKDLPIKNFLAYVKIAAEPISPFSSWSQNYGHRPIGCSTSKCHAWSRLKLSQLHLAGEPFNTAARWRTLTAPKTPIDAYNDEGMNVQCTKRPAMGCRAHHGHFRAMICLQHRPNHYIGRLAKRIRTLTLHARIVGFQLFTRLLPTWCPCRQLAW